MVKQCASCRQAFPSFDDHQTSTHCQYTAGACQLDASNPCQACQGWSPKTWGKLRKYLRDARAKSASRGTRQWMTTVPSLDMWLEGSSTSSDIISEVSSIILIMWGIALLEMWRSPCTGDQLGSHPPSW